jgi:orotate phosphoribosyltransferase
MATVRAKNTDAPSKISTTTPTATARVENIGNAGDGATVVAHAVEERASETCQNAYTAQREALRHYINDHGIARVPQGGQELWALHNSGFYDNKFNIWQFYLRDALLKSEHLMFIARCFWTVYKPRFHKRPFQIAGVEQASIPILTTLLLTAPGMGGVNRLHAFTIRKEPKSFGYKNIIEGKPDYNLPVVFIDDLTSPTHATLWHWIRTMRDARLPLYGTAFVVVYKGKRDELKTLPTTIGDVSIETIYTLEDFNMTYEEYRAHKARTLT